MKPTKRQLETFPSVVTVQSSDGKESLGEIPGDVLWDYMVSKGYKTFSVRNIKKAVNEFVLDGLELLRKKSKTTLKTKKATKKHGRIKKTNKKKNS